jgi:hypothetical protein
VATRIAHLTALLSFDVATGGLRAFQSLLKGTSSLASDLLRKTVLVGGAVTGVFLKGVVDANREYESLQTRLRSLQGPEKAAKTFAELKAFARETPFALNEIVDAFIRLNAAGFDVDKAKLGALGDLAAASGKPLKELVDAILASNRGLGSMVDNFVGLSATGEGAKGGIIRVSDAVRGINGQLVKTKGELLDFWVGAGLRQGVAGGSAALARTLGGAFDILSEATTAFLVEVGQAGAADQLRGLLGDLTRLIDGSGGLARMIGGALARALNWLRGALLWLQANGPAVWAVLRARVENLTASPAWGLLRRFITQAIDLFDRLGQADLTQLLDALTVLGVAFGVLVGLGVVLGSTLNFFVTLLVLAGLAALDLALYLQTGSSALYNWANANRAAGGATGIFADTVADLYEWVGRFVNEQAPVFNSLLAELKANASLLGDALGRLAVALGLVTDEGEATEALGRTFRTFLEQLLGINAIKGGLEYLAWWFRNALDALIDLVHWATLLINLLSRIDFGAIGGALPQIAGLLPQGQLAATALPGLGVGGLPGFAAQSALGLLPALSGGNKGSGGNKTQTNTLSVVVQQNFPSGDPSVVGGAAGQGAQAGGNALFGLLADEQ